jgi:3',5'-nucleoside bisphosphate phosphatase
MRPFRTVLMPMIELHCHTTFSDGTLTPTRLVESAVMAGVQAIAITDHDTMAGWDEARQAAIAPDLYHRLSMPECPPIEIVPGLELSTVHNGKSMHILGFYPDREKLQGPLQERLEGRKRRAQEMLDKLAALGYPVVLPEMGTEMAPGRPHVARAMWEAGYVKDIREAFDRFLGDGMPACVEYEKFEATEGIELILACDGIPVWAHPYLFRGGEVEIVLPKLLAAGLMGIEVYHPSHTEYQQEKLARFCETHGLLMTGGSDYHGPGVGHHAGLNSQNVSMALLDRLKAARKKEFKDSTAA